MRMPSPTGEVLFSVLDAAVLTALGIIPFDAEPDACGAVDAAGEANSANVAGEAYTGANFRQSHVQTRTRRGRSC